MNAMRASHKQVLYTMRTAGIITKQAMKSIRGQLMDMSDNDREEYLKKVIRNSVRTITKHKMDDAVLRTNARIVAKIN